MARVLVQRRERYDAVVIHTEEDRALVRSWLAENGVPNAQRFDLSGMEAKQEVFLREARTKKILVVPAQQYVQQYEVVEASAPQAKAPRLNRERGYTSHGYTVPFMHQLGSPERIEPCGGPSLCSSCQHDINEARMSDPISRRAPEELVGLVITNKYAKNGFDARTRLMRIEKAESLDIPDHGTELYFACIPINGENRYRVRLNSRTLMTHWELTSDN